MGCKAPLPCAHSRDTEGGEVPGGSAWCSPCYRGHSPEGCEPRPRAVQCGGRPLVSGKVWGVGAVPKSAGLSSRAALVRNHRCGAQNKSICSSHSGGQRPKSGWQQGWAPSAGARRQCPSSWQPQALAECCMPRSRPLSSQAAPLGSPHCLLCPNFPFYKDVCHSGLRSPRRPQFNLVTSTETPLPKVSF